MKRSSVIIIVALVIVLAGVAYALYSSQAPVNAPNSAENQDQNTAAATGRVILAVKDAATASLQGATAILLTVDKVEVHGATQDWMVVSTSTKQYDLLKLKASGAAQLLADINLPAGTYDQIRLNISKVEVTAGGKTTAAKLPSSTLKIVGSFTVTAGQTSAATLDFMADKSLHLTGKGTYILSPVVKLTTQSSADVAVDTDQKVTVRSGVKETEKTVGMDEKGETHDDFELKGELDVDVNGAVHIKGNTETKGSDDNEGSGGASAAVTLSFAAQNNSGITGTATLEPVDGKVKVTLDLKSSVLDLLTAAPEPAHIHVGACPNPGAVKYPLNSVVAGKSVTILNVSLATLKAGLPLAVNVHKSTADIATYIACADIKL